MQKNSITNKISPCCNLPFSVVYWWVSNLTLNSEADREFIISKISQNGTITIDGWKVLINSGTLEADASLTKAEFLAWFDCGKQPNCEQLKLIVEGFKIGNWDKWHGDIVALNEAFSSYKNDVNDEIQEISDYVRLMKMSNVNLCSYSFFDKRAEYGYFKNIPDANSTASFGVKKNGRECLYINGSNGTGFYGNGNHSFPLKNELIGKKVTISFDVFPNSQISKFKIGIAGSINSIESPSVVVGKWQRISYQQIVPQNENYIILFGGDENNDFYIANLCITDSEYISDYYPSIEDLTIGFLSKQTKGWLDQLLPAGTTDFGSLTFPKGVAKIGYDENVAHLSFNGTDLTLTINGVVYALNKTAL